MVKSTSKTRKTGSGRVPECEVTKGNSNGLDDEVNKQTEMAMQGRKRSKTCHEEIPESKNTKSPCR